MQLFEFGEEGPKEQVGLNFTTLCVSPDLIGMQFGRAVDFVDDGTVVVSDNNRIFVSLSPFSLLLSLSLL